MQQAKTPKFHQFFLENLKDRAEVGNDERNLAIYAQQALVMPLIMPEAYGSDATVQTILGVHSNAFGVELHEEMQKLFFANIRDTIESYTGVVPADFDNVVIRLDLVSWLISMTVSADRVYVVLIRIQDLLNPGWLYDDLVKSGQMTEDEFTAKVSTFYFSNAVELKKTT